MRSPDTISTYWLSSSSPSAAPIDCDTGRTSPPAGTAIPSPRAMGAMPQGTI